MHDRLLAHIRKFVALPAKGDEVIKDSFKLIKVKKKAFLLEPDKICKNNYFVVSGCIRMYFINQKLNEHITQFGIENWWITDLESFSQKKPSRYYIQAVQDSVVLSIEASKQQELFAQIPEMQAYFKHVYQRAFIASQRRSEFILNMSDEERYKHFMELNPWFLQRVPQYMLASYLGFTPQFMSRLRAKKD